MARVKMSQLCRWSDGTIASPRELLDSGRGYIDVVERLHAPRSAKGYQRAVFVCMHGTQNCVEVSAMVAKEER